MSNSYSLTMKHLNSIMYNCPNNMQKCSFLSHRPVRFPETFYPEYVQFIWVYTGHAPSGGSDWKPLGAAFAECLPGDIDTFPNPNLQIILHESHIMQLVWLCIIRLWFQYDFLQITDRFQFSIYIDH